jgi:hypothetical protein
MMDFLISIQSTVIPATWGRPDAERESFSQGYVRAHVIANVDCHIYVFTRSVVFNRFGSAPWGHNR